MYIILFGACLNILLNFFLIPKFSIYGAAWATVIAEVFNLYLLQHFVQWKADLGVVTKMVVFAAANVGLMVFLKQYELLNVLWLGVAVFVINAVLLYWSGLITWLDIKFLPVLLAKLASFWPAGN